MKWTLETWAQVPTVAGRIAVEADFHQRVAIYWQDSAEARAIDIDLPHPAIVTLANRDRIAVIVVQAERLPDQRTGGVYDMLGAYAADGASMLFGADECELVDDKNPDWLKLLGYAR